MLEQQGMGPGIDLGDMVKGTTAIDVRTGLLGALGDIGRLLRVRHDRRRRAHAMVMFMEVVDEDGLLDTKETLEELLNALAMGPASG